jgi:ribosomal protein S18 acetylase RimI-like enzyme
MKVTIQEYQPSDRQELVRLMEMLQDFLADIDPLHRLRRLPEYGELYTEALFKKISGQAGVIYVAKQGQEILGCIAGNIEEPTKEEHAGTAGSRSGRVLELVVQEDCRGKGIGALLMKKMEDYFRLKGCDIVRVEVFVPNTTAHSFYHRMQYDDRVYDMVKQL